MPTIRGGRTVLTDNEIATLRAEKATEPDGDWILRAACGTVPMDRVDELYFPDVFDPLPEVLALCAACPVRPECLATALANRYDTGVWGGIDIRGVVGRRTTTPCADTVAIATLRVLPRGRHPCPTAEGDLVMTGAEPGPVSDEDRARRHATGWLRRLHQNPTPERVDALAPYTAQRWDRQRSAAADYLVAHRELPTAEALSTYLRERGASRAARDRRANHDVSEHSARILTNGGHLPDDIAERALTFVQQIRDATGSGPTWRELGNALGYSRADANIAITDLHRTGALASTRQPRSLRVATCRGV